MALIAQNNFVFIHIYKCAGRSIRSVIQGNSPVREIAQGHSTAQEARDHCYANGGQFFWDNAYKFTFIRNPFDWVVSLYHFITQNPDHENFEAVRGMTFEQFVHWNAHMVKGGYRNSTGSFNTLSGFVCDDNGAGRVILDFVGRMENLNEDLATVCNNIGVAMPENLPVLNKSTREPDYRKYYNETTIQIVSDVYALDLQRFDYKF